MLYRLLLAALLAGLSSHAEAQTAQVVPTCGASSGLTLALGPGGRLAVTPDGTLCTVAGGGGGSGATGSVTPAGTNGTSAQAVQGINGGVPVATTMAPAAGSQEQDVRSSGTLAAAAQDASIIIPVNGQSSVGLRFSGLAASGATLTFEQSNDGGTTYTGVNEVNAGTGVPSLTRTTDGQSRIAVQGRTNLRIRVSTVGTGTVSVAWTVSVREGLFTLASPLPPGANTVGSIANTAFGISGPIPAGTNTIGAVTTTQLPATLGPKTGAQSTSVVLATDEIGPSLGANAIGVIQQDALIPAGSPFSASSVTTLYTLDTTGYQSIANALSGTFAATVVYETSNDGTNWIAQVGTAVGSTGAAAPASTDNAVTTRIFPAAGRFFRARTSAYTSGTVTATPVLRVAPNPTQGVYVGGGAISLNTGFNQIGGTYGATASGAGGVATIARLPSSANSTNLTQVKNAAGRLYKVVACNTTTTSARIKFYNALSANVTVGTTTPFLTRPLPAAASAGGLNCANYDVADIGWYFSTGISYALVTGAADTDTTAVAAGAITDLSVEVQ